MSEKPNTSLKISLRSGNPEPSNPWRRRALYSLVAVPVIRCALVRIAQDAVGFVGFLEFVFGGVIAGIQVRVELARNFLVCALERLLIACPVDAEDFVVIAFRHAHFEEGWTATFTIAGRSSLPLKLYPRWNSSSTV